MAIHWLEVAMGSPLNRFILGVLLWSLSPLSWGAARGPIVIAGGDLNGVYFQIAGEFCRLASLDNPDLVCSVMPSAGSAENLQLLREGVANLALVQGDLLYWAQRGEGPYQGRAIPQLRSVMATHAEPFTLMVLSTQTANLASLQGKPLYLGAEHSGSRTTALLVLKQLGLPDVEQQEVAVDDPMTALCEQKIAAWAMVIGHPNKQVLDVAKRCAIRFVPILPRYTPGAAEKYPFYRVSQIPGRLYPGVLTNTPTLALPAIMVTTDRMDNQLVSGLITGYWQHRKSFNKKVSAYANLFRLPAHMQQAAMLIPMHPAAATALAGLR
jgi:uncharacterized protein